MSESFKKLKNKYLVSAIIKSVNLGIACGLFTVGEVMLALNLCKIAIQWGFFVLIGVGVAILAGGGLFLLLRPTDVKMAKILDAQYNLGEKTQTMVAFADQTGDLIDIQRKDASERLENLPKAKVNFGAIGLHVAATVLGIAMLILAILLNPYVQNNGVVPPGGPVSGDPVQEQPDDDDKWEYDLFLQAMMADLILNVRESSLIDNEKAAYLTVLEELDGVLKLTTSESRMKITVIAAIKLLDGITDNVSTFRKISTEMSKFEDVLSPAVVDAATCYKEYKSQITTLRYVQALELELASWAEQRLAEPITNSSNSIKLRNNSDTGEALAQFIEGLSQTLENADVDTNDALYLGVKNFYNELRDVLSKVNKGYGATKNNVAIDAAYNSFNNAVVASLKNQSYNGIMNIFTRQKLAGIFDISLSDMPPLPEDLQTEGGSTGDDDPGDEPGSSSSGGGYGDGGENYGSNDLIYDPETGEKVPYGQVLDNYYKKYISQISSGEYEYVGEYFKILFSGIEGYKPE